MSDTPDLARMRPIPPMTHEQALDAICGCTATVTVLSYEEAIGAYFKLRDLGDPAAQRPLLDRIAELEGERDEAREDARLRLAQKPYDEAYERVEPIIQTLVKAVIGDEEFAVQTAANEVLEAAFRNTFDRDWRSLFAARLAAEAQVSALQAQVDGLREVGVLQEALERAWRDCGAMAPHLSAPVINIIGRHMSHHIRDVVRERASLTHKAIRGGGE